MARAEDETVRPRKAETKRWLLVFVALTVALTAVLALLLRENHELRAQFRALAATKARAGGLELERAVAPLRLTDASGASVTVRFEGEAVGTLLLFHAAGCGACARTSASWRAALAAADRPDVRVLCVQTDGAQGAPLALEGLPASLAVPLPPAGWLAALPAVPATLLVDYRGVLTWAEYGELSADSAQSLTAALATVGMHAPAPAPSAGAR